MKAIFDDKDYSTFDVIGFMISGAILYSCHSALGFFIGILFPFTWSNIGKYISDSLNKNNRLT